MTNPATASRLTAARTWLARTGTAFQQDYINLLYRMNAGQPYYGNFMCDWWFYDPYGTGTSATNYQDYIALCQICPGLDHQRLRRLALRPITSACPWAPYNTTGYNASNYQARIIGGAGALRLRQQLVQHHHSPLRRLAPCPRRRGHSQHFRSDGPGRRCTLTT